MTASNTPPEAQAVRELATAYERMREQIGKVIVGQKAVVEQLLMALFSRGHCLLVGVPGLAKTLLVRFMSTIIVGYPGRDEEMDIMKRTTSLASAFPEPFLDAEQILKLQEVVRQVVVADHVFAYAADLVRATRPREKGVPKFVPE